MQETYTLTAAQADAVRKALKLLKFQYWSYTIEIDPMKKKNLRIVIKPTFKVDLDESGHEWNKIVRILSNAGL